MTEWRTQYNALPIHTNPGQRLKLMRTSYYDDVGRIALKVIATEDLYDYIQSHRDSVDIHVLMARFRAGDTDALTRVQGFYGDITDSPTTYAGMLNSVLAGQHAFERLPVEVKERFHNSFSEWLAAMDSSDFAERMGYTSEEFSQRVSDVQPSPAPSGSDGDLPVSGSDGEEV